MEEHDNIRKQEALNQIRNRIAGCFDAHGLFSVVDDCINQANDLFEIAIEANVSRTEFREIAVYFLIEEYNRIFDAINLMDRIGIVLTHTDNVGLLNH